MNIDTRLHHAARELREISIEVPPLGELPATSQRRSRVPAVAASLLLLAGGLTAWSGLAGTSPTEPNVAAPLSIDAGSTTPELSARQEIAMISMLTSDRPSRFLQPPTGVA